MLRWLLVDGRLELGPDGRLLVVRPPLPGEAARLRTLAGLPVPEVVDERDGGLVLTWTPPADDLPALAAEVAATLAAAHERGVAHGPLVADHVRSGGVVDGWAGGDPADDVAALGRLLLDVGPLPAEVAALARRAASDHPSLRPTMAAVAAALLPPSLPSEPPVAPAAAATTSEATPASPLAATGPGRSTSRPGGRRVPAWVPAVAAIPVAVLALLAAAGGGEPAAVAVEVRCGDVATAAVLDAASGELLLDDGLVLPELPPGCEVVVLP